MSLPELVSSLLGDESVAAEVSLGGEDALYVTPSRTLLYRAEGLLSDESVDQYGHDAERIAVSEGRRKAKVTLDYGLDGEERFSVPAKRLDDVLHPLVAGVLNAADITGSGETVRQTFRFSELTVVVTDARVVKHIGAAVWDGDFEEFHYDDVTDLDFEDGTVATSVVVTMGDRQERFKAPNESARAVREALKAALLSYHDAPNLPAFRKAMTPDEGPEAPSTGSVDFGDGPDPLSAEPAADAEAEAEAETDGRTRTDAAGAADPAQRAAGGATGAETSATGESSTPSASSASVAVAATEAAPSAANGSETTGERQPASQSTAPADGSTAAAAEPAESTESTGSVGTPGTAESAPTADESGTAEDEFAESGFQPAGPVDDRDVAEGLAELTAAVEAQSEELRRQRETFERLVEELRRGR
ncbi:hypothetical protein ACFO0N_06235 [Halobium salinum]|uniref:DUF7115 domain-containing protein n=1 Tax=Halobium salinum TaxID=1364940 RepID=A0ABD5PA66_9EURY|nr:hypothetical protein [Halobium salinum]